MERRCSSLEFLELLAELYLGEESGRLVVDDPAAGGAELWLDRGLLRVARGLPAEDAGAILVTRGDLDQAALDAVRADGSGVPGELADVVDPGTLRAAVQESCRQVVFRAAALPDCDTRFDGGAALPEAPESDVLFTAATIIGAAGVTPGFAAIAERLASLESAVRLRRRRAFPLEQLPLGPAEGFVLSRLDGSLSLGEAISALPPEQEDEAARFVFGLAILGVATFEPPLGQGRFRLAHLDGMSGAKRDEGKAVALLEEMLARVNRAETPAEVLGIARDADEATVQKAYLDLRGELDEIRKVTSLVEERPRDLSMLESRMTESLLSFKARGARPVEGGDNGSTDWTHLEARREYEKTSTRRSEERAHNAAEAYYEKAKHFFGLKDYHSCIEYMTQAIRLQDQVGPFYYLLGQARAMNPDHRWQRKAEMDFIRAIELDPFNPDYMISLARLYKQQGLGLRAKKMLRQALEIEPTNADAAAELRTL